MADTFNKKERNKKKLQKRKEKEQRRDEKRQEPSSKGKSLDDMIAYVDEYGNITSTPPDPTRKSKEVALEDIRIDTPKAAPVDPNALPTGVITYFDVAKGYGFISNPQTDERIFVHVNQLADSSVTLSAGDKVEYTAVKGPRGLQAESVRKL